MRGRRKTQDDFITLISLESLVPDNHILRKIEKEIDFSFIDTQTEGLYSDRGRPSIDPQVLIRMMLIGYLFGITSEGRLCQEVQVNIAYRWFCGLGLADKVADHSTFSKNRHGRFARKDLFRELFYEIVKQAMDKGLVRGKHFSTDATLMAADAAMSSLEPIVVPYDQGEYLEKMDEQSQNNAEGKPENKTEQTPENKAETKPKKSPPINETHRSRSDGEAQVATRWGSKKKLCYSDNYLIDNQHSIIVDVEVTTPSLTEEALSSVEMLKRSRFRLGLNPETIGADSAYSRGEVLSGFKEVGVKAYTPEPQGVPKPDEKYYNKKEFVYDEETDSVICPQGERLNRVKDSSKPRMAKFVGRKRICANCPLKSRCTGAEVRSVSIHLDQEAIDWAAKLRKSKEYALSQRMRKRIEKLFGEAKEQMGLRRAKYRGMKHLTEQCLMTALAQNIKRIVNKNKSGPINEDTILQLSLKVMFRAIGRHRMLIFNHYAYEYENTINSHFSKISWHLLY